MELGASAKQDMVAVADEPSEHNHPDLEKQQQQPPPLTTKAADGGCGWWYEYCKAKAFSFPWALALVLVLLTGIAQLVVYWEDLLGLFCYAHIVLILSMFASVLALSALPDPDDQLECCCAGRPLGLVLALAREVVWYVGVFSVLMFYLMTLVLLLAVLLAIAESWAYEIWCLLGPCKK